MAVSRYAKIIMCFVLGLFCLLVTFDNVTDYGTKKRRNREMAAVDELDFGIRDIAFHGFGAWGKNGSLALCLSLSR
jgi:predicted small integral membrane protein